MPALFGKAENLIVSESTRLSSQHFQSGAGGELGSCWSSAFVRILKKQFLILAKESYTSRLDELVGESEDK